MEIYVHKFLCISILVWKTKAKKKKKSFKLGDSFLSIETVHHMYIMDAIESRDTKKHIDNLSNVEKKSKQAKI